MLSFFRNQKNPKSPRIKKVAPGVQAKKHKTKFNRQSPKEIQEKFQAQNSEQLNVFFGKTKKPKKTIFKKKSGISKKSEVKIGKILYSNLIKIFKIEFWVYILQRILIIIRWKSWHKLIFGYLIVASLVAGFIYINFWDRYFLVRNYEIQFASQDGYNSYLSPTQLRTLIKEWQSAKNYGILPNNQYWYSNSKSYLQVAKTLYPEITNVEIEQKIWPNKIKLKIYTEPILATLKLSVDSRDYYLRVDHTGKVLNFDKAGLKDELIDIELKTTSTSEQELLNFDFSQNSLVFNRLWFTKEIRRYFVQENLGLINIKYPTPIDTDLKLVLTNGTEFWMTSDQIPWENQIARIKFFYSNPQWVTDLESRTIKYVDFRINHKIFICYYNRGC